MKAERACEVNSRGQTRPLVYCQSEQGIHFTHFTRTAGRCVEDESKTAGRCAEDESKMTTRRARHGCLLTCSQQVACSRSLCTLLLPLCSLFSV